MITKERIKYLEKQGYRIVGNHSAIKTCHYCKAAIKGKDVCYKNTFYNIASWRCIQATVTLDLCNLRCRWCWRDINHGTSSGSMFTDEPQDICKINKWKIIDEKQESRVVLIMKEDSDERYLKEEIIEA